MTVLIFPDNTVLVNFAKIGRMPLLAGLVGNNGQWCGTVAAECARSSIEPGLGSMQDAQQIFGEPLLPQSRQEHVDTQTIRLSFVKPGDGPKRHLGEAETLSIITNRQLVALFVTDDGEASTRAQSYGISTCTTWDLLRLAVKTNRLTVVEAWRDVHTLNGHLRKNVNLRNETVFNAWCR